MTRAERRRAKRESKKRASREERRSRQEHTVFACPFCMREFGSLEELIDHQDRLGHVVSI